MLFLLSYEIIDYWLINLTLYHVNVNSNNINFLLINSINKYHPFIFYMSILSLFNIFCISISLFYNRLNLLFSHVTWDLIWVKHVELNLVAIIFTLFLGSWWAVQEGSWGGWWNWDPSEVFGLLIMLLLFLIVHKKTNHNIKPAVTYLILIYWILVSSLYIFIQLNFNLVSHNFGIKTTQFINTTQIFVIIWGLICGISLFISRNYIHETSYYLLWLNPSSQVQPFSKVITYFIFLVIVLCEFVLSFYPLISDFFWQLFHKNLTSFLLNYDTTTILGLITIILFFWKPSKYYIVLSIFLWYFNSWILFLLSTVFFPNTLIFVSHYLLVLFVLINIYISTKVWVNWFLLTNLTYINSQYITYTWGLVNYSLHSNTLEFELTMLHNNLPYSKIFGFSTQTITSNNELFSQLTSTCVSYQHLVEGLLHKTFSILVGDTSLLYLYTIFIFILSLIYLYFVKKKLIIF